MAIITNTYKTYEQKGIREQLANVIYNISPEETPVISSMAKPKAKSTLFEWQTDALAAVDTANAHLEGDDVTSFAAVTPTVRVGNYMQISRKTLIVSDTAEEVDKAGRDSEIAYQTAMRSAELKRDMESIVLLPQAGDAGGSATARKTATLGAWIKTNVDKASDGANPNYTSGVPALANGRTDGTLRAFTETILKSVLQLMWTNGATIPGLEVNLGPVNKGKFSGFAGIATKTTEISSAKPHFIIGAADVYQSEYGKIVAVPNRFQREVDAWFLDFKWLEMPHLRPMRRVKLAKTGDAEKLYLVNEWALKVKQEKGLGLAADLTTT